MKRLLPVVALFAVLLAVVPGASLATTRTTSPAYNFDIVVTITDKNVVLDRSVAKRGWLAHFIIHNKSKKPIRFEVGGLKSKLIQPGRSSKVGAYLSSRGQFAYKVDDETRGYFQVL
jgi:hypothetical protein